MIRKTLIAALAAAVAMPVMAQDVSLARREAFISLLAGEGCSLSSSEAERVFGPTDFTKDETRAIVGALIDEGVASRDGDMLVLFDSICTPGSTTGSTTAAATGGAGGRAGELAALIAANGCRMTEDEAEGILPPAGFDKDESRAIVDAWTADGAVSFDGDALVLGEALCAGTGDRTDGGTTVDVGPADPRRDEFIAMVAGNGCSVMESEADALMDSHGFTYEEANRILDELIEEGVATFDGNLLNLSPTICTAGDGGTDIAAPAGTPTEIFIAWAASHGCAVTEAQAEAELPGLGLTMEQTEPMVGAMMDAGNATFEGGQLVLAPAICPPGGASVAVTGGSNADRLGAAIAARGCSITEEAADAVLDESGITEDQAEMVMEQWLASGEATFDGETLALAPDYCAGFAGGPSVTEPVMPVTKAAMLAEMISANGCTLTDAESETLLDGTSITEDEAAEIVMEWLVSGQATLENDILTLSPDLCTATTGGMTLDPRGELLRTAIKGTGCSMTEAQAEATLPPLGMDLEEAEDIAGAWIDQGLASFEGRALVLDPGFCAGGGDGASLDGGMTEADRLAQVIRDNGCAMSGAQAEAELPAMGFTEGSVEPIVEGWMNAGLATLDGGILTLSHEFCAGTVDTGATMSPEDRVHAQVALLGCSFDPENDAVWEKLEADTGLGENDLENILEGWLDSGKATYDDASNVFTVLPAFCTASAGGGGSDYATMLVTIIEQHGCSMTGAEGESIIPAAGIPAEMVPGIVEGLVAAGTASLANDTLTVFTENCQ